MPRSMRRRKARRSSEPSPRGRRGGESFDPGEEKGTASLTVAERVPDCGRTLRGEVAASRPSSAYARIDLFQRDLFQAPRGQSTRSLGNRRARLPPFCRVAIVPHESCADAARLDHRPAASNEGSPGTFAASNQIRGLDQLLCHSWSKGCALPKAT